MDDDIWVVEREQVMVEGEVIAFSVDFIGATSVSSPSSKVYKNGADYSSTAQSGSDSASGPVVTLNTITAQANNGGSVYVGAGFDRREHGKTQVPDPGGGTRRGKLMGKKLKAPGSRLIFTAKPRQVSLRAKRRKLLLTAKAKV